MSVLSADRFGEGAGGLGLLALAAQAKGQAMQLHTAKHAKELQRQVGVRERRRLDAAVDARHQGQRGSYRQSHREASRGTREA